ncbi:MAG: hypothetical protein DHS20C19_12730 [Acidimicrobiales bacterium]|nr:MAG: hypothetical protein DHS20C19_12730 [Acidimicrobiales bacterium]
MLCGLITLGLASRRTFSDAVPPLDCRRSLCPGGRRLLLQRSVGVVGNVDDGGGYDYGSLGVNTSADGRADNDANSGADARS